MPIVKLLSENPEPRWATHAIVFQGKKLLFRSRTEAETAAVAIRKKGIEVQVMAIRERAKNPRKRKTIASHTKGYAELVSLNGLFVVYTNYPLSKGEAWQIVRYSDVKKWHDARVFEVPSKEYGEELIKVLTK